MDEKRPDQNDALRELAAKEAADAGLHAGWQRLIAYRWGTLPAAEREALQEHLSLCPECADRLLELRDLETASVGGGAEGRAAFREEAWESLSPITIGRHAAHVRSRVELTPESFEALLRFLDPDREQAAVKYEAFRRRLARFFDGRGFVNPEDLADETLVQLAWRFQKWTAMHAADPYAYLSSMALLVSRNAERRATGNAAIPQGVTDSPFSRSGDDNLDNDLDLSGAERQLAAARVRARLKHLKRESSRMRELAKWASGPEWRDQAASREVQVSVAPHRAQRGQEAVESGFLLGGDAENSVRISAQGDDFTAVINLADYPVYPEYRLELIDRNGKVLWTGHRPGKALLGDAGTEVSIRGLGPGRYRLRIEGRHPGRTELLAKYLLAVEWQETPTGVEWPVGAQGPRWRARPEANEILSRGLGASSRTTAGRRAAQLTSGSLEALLGFLDPDRDQAAFKYEAIRRRLVRLFEWRGFGNPQDLSDETINRVALRLAEGVDVRSADPYGYFCGVAHLVCKETARRVARERIALGREEWQPAPPADLEEDDRLACLHHCLERLPNDQRVLVLRYHQEDDHIRSRQALAEELGIPMTTLRIRVHRIRRKLEECVAACLQAGSIRDNESPDRPLPHISPSPKRE